MNEKLKECPFCGNDMVYIDIKASNDPQFRGWCFKCQAKTRDCKTREEARLLWNTRVGHPANGGKKVYRAGDMVPNGWYWAETESGMLTPASVVDGQLRIFEMEREVYYQYLETFTRRLIPIDRPEGISHEALSA